MTDLEITKLCAEAMGLPTDVAQSDETGPYLKCSRYHRYQPLYDDAQNAQLEWWLIQRGRFEIDNGGFAYYSPGIGTLTFNTPTIEAKRRAICECVAKLQSPKAK